MNNNCNRWCVFFIFIFGLFDDSVYQILEDDRGNLWMGCYKGIYRVSRQELDDFCEGRITTVHCTVYNEKDGIGSRETGVGI